MHKCRTFSLAQDAPSPLTVACHEGHTEIVDSLLKSGADPNLAIEVEWLLEYGSYICTYPFFSQNSCFVPLGVTAAKGHADTVERLLEGGANANYCNKVRKT